MALVRQKRVIVASEELPIEASVIEAAAKALKRLEHCAFGANQDDVSPYAYYFYDGPERETVIAKAPAYSAIGGEGIPERIRAEAVIRAADEARGMKVERRGNPSIELPQQYRLVSGWFPESKKP